MKVARYAPGVLSLLVSAALSSACGRTVGNTNPDGGFVPDAAAPDASAIDGALSDGRTPGRDATAVTPDAEAPPRSDVVAPPPVDVPTLPDGRVDPAAPLYGTWRLVAYEFNGDNGRRQTLIDENTPLRFGPATIDARVNGVLVIEPERSVYVLGILINDHFFVREDAEDAATGLSAFGFTFPSTLMGDRLVFGENMLDFARNADGTISQVDADSGARSTWSRTSLTAGALDGYSARGRALPMTDAMPVLQRPRAALAWDGRGSGNVYTNDVPLTRSSLGNYEYPVTIGAPPPEALVPVGAGRAAIAYVLAYEDSNDNRRYDPGADTLRGVSQSAIVFRDAPDGDAVRASAIRNMPQGYRLASVHPDLTTGRRTIEPFDTSTSVTPDVALSSEVFTGEVPDLLR